MTRDSRTCYRLAAGGVGRHHAPPCEYRALDAHVPDLAFADRIAQLEMGGLTVDTEGQRREFHHVHTETDADDDGGSDTDDVPDGDDVPPTECPYAPARGGGKPPLAFGCSTAITLLNCA
ncbi:hypothetical protein CYMTET_12954 [Cymbomonas tetramitiformis]|uniref:Uncharacterized protein n=1 Tax=Cymbomonas tetramitiformis TaxID=36881 RepID=A0AAE0GJE2_9CHLO|nr:hypothetical protein CYMTET_12954 [Cymbomonas tetramitiformis]